MPVLPAFCDSCGAVFSSGFAVEGSANVTLSGNRSGPCPVCGGMGHIPDGVFNFVGNTIEILSAPERTRRELRLLSKIIEEARSKRHSREDIARKIEEELPALRSIGQFLPQNRAELYGFLALILAAIQLFSQSSIPSSQSTTVNVTQVINQTIIQPAVPQEKPKPVIKEKKPGRNEPCTCGSGKKYKKCCGASS